jgi:hypothetical protein
MAETSKMTLSGALTFSITTLNIMTLSIKAIRITAFTIMPFCRMPFSKATQKFPGFELQFCNNYNYPTLNHKLDSFINE